jgi:endoglucanase
LSVFRFLIGAYGRALHVMLAEAIYAKRLCIAVVRLTVPKSAPGSRLGPLLASVVLALGASLAHGGDDPLALHRGVNVQNWLKWTDLTPGGDRRRPPGRAQGVSISDFDVIKALGFDFVRLSVDPGPLLSADGDYRLEAFNRLERAVRLVRRSGLKVVLTLQAASQAELSPATSPEVSATNGLQDRDRAVVAGLAGMLLRVGANATALELTGKMDSGPCDGPSGRAWEAQVEVMVRAARETARDLTLIVSGACGGNAKGLVQLNLAALKDDRLLFSFNFYEPTGFTWQGVGAAKDIKGAPWPADAVAKPLAMVFSKLLINQDAELSLSDREGRIAAVRRYLDRYLAGGWEESRLKARLVKSALGQSDTIYRRGGYFLGRSASWPRTRIVEVRSMPIGSAGSMPCGARRKRWALHGPIPIQSA